MGQCWHEPAPGKSGDALGVQHVRTTKNSAPARKPSGSASVTPPARVPGRVAGGGQDAAQDIDLVLFQAHPAEQPAQQSTHAAQRRGAPDPWDHGRRAGPCPIPAQPNSTPETTLFLPPLVHDASAVILPTR